MKLVLHYRFGRDCQCNTHKVLTIMTILSYPMEWDSVLFGRSGSTELANKKLVQPKLCKFDIDMTMHTYDKGYSYLDIFFVIWVSLISPISS